MLFSASQPRSFGTFSCQTLDCLLFSASQPPWCLLTAALLHLLCCCIWFSSSRNKRSINHWSALPLPGILGISRSWQPSSGLGVSPARVGQGSTLVLQSPLPCVMRQREKSHSETADRGLQPVPGLQFGHSQGGCTWLCHSARVTLSPCHLSWPLQALPCPWCSAEESQPGKEFCRALPNGQAGSGWEHSHSPSSAHQGGRTVPSGAGTTAPSCQGCPISILHQPAFHKLL